MCAAWPTLVLLAATEESIPPAGTAVRTVVRIVLGSFIAVLVAYILLEQIGSWRRRRAAREP
jgi:hypothetical protein